MKKYLYLALVTLIATMPFALTSCSNDDEPGDGKSDIVGEWEYDSHKWTPSITKEEAYYMDEMIDMGDIEFGADGRYYADDDLYDGKPYKVNGDKITVGDWTVKFSMPDKNTLILYCEIVFYRKYTCAVTLVRADYDDDEDDDY